MDKEKQLQQAYTILISAIPILRLDTYRAFTKEAKYMSAMLHNAAIEWILEYSKDHEIDISWLAKINQAQPKKNIWEP